jgi:hypothetical protein
MKTPVFALFAKARPSRLAIVGAVIAASMCFTEIARADSLTGAFYYQYLGPYTTLGLGSTPSSAPSVPATETFTLTSSPSVNLFSFNLYDFLTVGGDTTTSLGSAGTDNINNGVFVFTGYSYLAAGTQYDFTHDDGMILYLTGFGLNNAEVINSPGATSADISTFTVPTSGSYSFELIYAEVNGGPAVLTSDNFDSNIAPEPSSLLLMGTGLLGLAFVLFRKNKPSGLGLQA